MLQAILTTPKPFECTVKTRHGVDCAVKDTFLSDREELEKYEAHLALWETERWGTRTPYDSLDNLDKQSLSLCIILFQPLSSTIVFRIARVRVNTFAFLPSWPSVAQLVERRQACNARYPLFYEAQSRTVDWKINVRSLFTSFKLLIRIPCAPSDPAICDAFSR